MRERTKRVAIAVLLTAMDVALLDRYFGVLWQAWSKVLWIRGGFLLLLALLVASASVLWTGQTRYRTEIVVFEVSLLSPAHTFEEETGSSVYRNGNGFVPYGQCAEPEITRQEVPY